MPRTYCLYWSVLAFSVLIAAPALADDYLIFTDAGLPGGGSDVWTWCENPPCDFAEMRECDTPEGSGHFRQRGVHDWQGFGVFHAIDPGPDGARNAWCAGPGDPFPCCGGAGVGSCSGDDFATPVDLSAFLGGELRFFVKSPFELGVELQCEVGGTEKGGSASLTQGGWDGTDTWQEIVIPLADFDFGAGPPIDLAACLSAVKAPFLSTGAGLAAIPGVKTFRVDNVRWRKPNSHAGPTPVEVSGRQLLVNGEPFVVNGMAYSPISIGENFLGAYRDRPDRYLVDFPLIAGSGANVVRLYTSFLTTGMLDAAQAAGLYVVPNFGIDPLKLTCDAGRDHQRNRFRETVEEWKNHPAILFWLLGNEVNAGQSDNQLCNTGSCSVTSAAACTDDSQCTNTWCSFQRCSISSSTICFGDGDCPGGETCEYLACTVDNDCPFGSVGAETCDALETCEKGWYTQLDGLAEAADLLAGRCSVAGTTCTINADCPGGESCILAQPVGTANAEVGQICNSCSQDGNLPHLDLWGAQIYRGCDKLDTAFADYTAKLSCTKPLVITEFGADAYDSVLGNEDEIMQGNCLERLLVDAEQALAVRAPGGVSSGQIVFSWADEWWKAFDNQTPPANCTNTDWATHDACIGWDAAGYTDFDCPQETPPAQCTADSGIQEEWWGIARAEPTGPADLRDAYTRVSDAWNLGAVNNMEVITHNPVTGDTTLSFDPGAGSTDHTLYYGPLNDVSTYGYTGSVSGLGADGSGAATLPAGDLFWIVVGRNAGAEGCYGKGSACSERPASPGAGIPQAASRTCSVPQCP